MRSCQKMISCCEVQLGCSTIGDFYNGVRTLESSVNTLACIETGSAGILSTQDYHMTES